MFHVSPSHLFLPKSTLRSKNSSPTQKRPPRRKFFPSFQKPPFVPKKVLQFNKKHVDGVSEVHVQHMMCYSETLTFLISRANKFAVFKSVSFFPFKIFVKQNRRFVRCLLRSRHFNGEKLFTRMRQEQKLSFSKVFRLKMCILR